MKGKVKLICGIPKLFVIYLSDLSYVNNVYDNSTNDANVFTKV
jgi:hypothetical protein